MSRTYHIPQRDLSALKAQLNSVGWFIPPFVSVGFIEMSLNLQAAKGNGPFTQSDLEEMLAFMYGPKHLAAMVLHRYPSVPVVTLYAKTIAEAVWAHFAGLHHVAVGGLIPVVEGVARRLAGERGLQSDGQLKARFRDLASSVKNEVVQRSIGATAEIIDMLDSFSCFIESYFYVNSDLYPLIDGTNRHGVVHGAFTDAAYGRPLNFFKTIAAIDFLTLISSFTTSRMSGLAPDDTPESTSLAARYLAVHDLCAMPSMRENTTI